MRVELGDLIPAISDWELCVDEPRCECTICVNLPEWASTLSDSERTYLALYVAARHLLEYRLAAAMHVHMVRGRAALRPELLVKALKEAKVVTELPRAIEDDFTYAWEAVVARAR